MSPHSQRQSIPVLANIQPVSHPLTRIDAIAEAVKPAPVTATFDVADAIVGCHQLRSIVAAFRMPAESRDLMLRIAAGLERAQ